MAKTGEIESSDSDMTASKRREMLGVNSPKATVGNIFPSHLMTQVTQDDEKRQRELAERLEKQTIEEEADENREEKHQKELEVISAEPPNRSSFCSSCACLLRCRRSRDAESLNQGEDGVGVENIEVQAIEAADKEVSNEEVGKTKDKEPVEAPVEEDSPSSSEPIEGLLAKQLPSDKGRKCLVLDLDETLVHSGFQPMDCSFSLPIELGGMEYQVYVLKRPHVDEFIKECAKTYELVVFTASLAEYANPVIDELDKARLIKHRLFRESCVLHQGQAYVKDLSRLGRKLKDCIIIDNSPLSYLFDRYNAIACTSWFGDEHDTELRDLLPVLNGSLSTVKDVRTMLDGNTKTCEWLIKTYGKPKADRKIAT